MQNESVVGVADACLARIDERDGIVQAWETIDRDRVRATAHQLDLAAVPGPLHGVSVGIKDIIDTADLATSYGSPMYAGHRPAADASCVALLREAGALIVGKTVTTEFATTHPSRTRNPLDPSRTPGGSSSGSAAAVADGMVRVALGTQTMGSIIRPAAYCGVVGFKPSFGLIDRAGVKPQAASVDTIGVIARSVDDAARVAGVLAARDVGAFDGYLDRPPRVTVARGPAWTNVDEAAVTALDAAMATFRAAGADVREASTAPLLHDALDAHLTIVVAEVARSMAFEYDRHREQLSATLIRMVESGRARPFDELLRAHRVAREARAWFDATFDATDVWLTVSAPGEAPLGLASTGDPIMNRTWTLLHVPVITVPAGVGPSGLPLGLQLIGRFHHDAQLVAAARWAEAHLTPAGPSPA